MGDAMVLDEWPLVGRDAELDVLLGCLAGRGAVVAGAAGVGKTRLARAAEAAARSAGRPVERVVATRSSRALPLAPFARLRTLDDTGDPLVALRQAIVGDHPAGAPVVSVDDAHLLDDASAALVHELCASGAATVLVTVRSRDPGDPAPDAVVALWKDELCERIELQPLSRHEVVALLAAALGAAVDATTAFALWRLSRGNVMYLRELVRGGLASGALAERSGLWAWSGEPHAPPRLVELLADRLAGLAPGQRHALELLALGEPLAWAHLVALLPPGEAESLLTTGLAEIDTPTPSDPAADRFRPPALAARSPSAAAASKADPGVGSQTSGGPSRPGDGDMRAEGLGRGHDDGAGGNAAGAGPAGGRSPAGEGRGLAGDAGDAGGSAARAGAAGAATGAVGGAAGGEDRGRVETGDGDLVVRLAHPLLGDVVEAEMTVPTRRLLLRELAAAATPAAGPGGPGGPGGSAGSGERPARLALWRLDAGEPVPAELLVEAAEECLYADARLGERFARAALAADPAVADQARLVLALHLMLSHRPTEADETLAAIDERSLAPADRVRLVVNRANNLTWALARPDDAVALLDQAANASLATGPAASPASLGDAGGPAGRPVGIGESARGAERGADAVALLDQAAEDADAAVAEAVAEGAAASLAAGSAVSPAFPGDAGGPRGGPVGSGGSARGVEGGADAVAHAEAAAAEDAVAAAAGSFPVSPGDAGGPRGAPVGSGESARSVEGGADAVALLDQPAEGADAVAAEAVAEGAAASLATGSAASPASPGDAGGPRGGPVGSGGSARGAEGGADAVAEAAAVEGAVVRGLRAHAVPMLVFAGRVGEALERAEAIVGDPASSPVERLRAGLGAVPALVVAGRPERALAWAAEALPLVGDEACRRELPIALGQLGAGASLAQLLSGDLDGADALMRLGYEEGVARNVPLMRGGAALRLGQVALWRGRPRSAAALVREAVLAMEETDAGFLAWAADTLRIACALVGDTAGIAAAGSIARRALRFPLYRTEVLRADAAVAAAAGRLSDARAAAAEGAEAAFASGQLIQAIVLLFDRARYGDARSAAARLDEVAGVEGALAALLRRTTAALAAADAAELEDVSLGFERHGYDLFAAEAARAAARAHAERGLVARERQADGRADSLAARCEGATTPLLALRPAATTLTRREREVAELAAHDLSDAEIARRLGLSVRTVETHLHRAYTKLGVTGRHALARFLG